ncbi:MAG: sugar ABC transporter permease [Solobacterium sp.]|nr:sugar ABC transporter permease [Solobacterium sp.]MCH4221991.1 sugar ABC transporter permease [Solobacterium sp.]MCH4266104.1 sugar ABC transporter permease [Solobacterium sp.]
MTQNKARSKFVRRCILPSLILFTIFMIIPTLNVFWMSLLKWGGLSKNKTFVGLNNFVILSQDMNFVRALQNTIFLIVIVTVVTMAAAVILASVLVRENLKGQNFFRVIFYIPNILSVVVISAIFSAIYDPANGLLNSIISLFQPSGWETIKFLGDQKIVVYSIAGAMIWQAIGYYMVMYMASMSSISPSLYEAAELDGATRVKQFFSITLPLIWNNIRTTLTFFIISTINLSFLFVKVMTAGGPDGASETVLSYLYKQAYNNASYGYGMAIGAVVFILSFALSAAVSHVTKRDVIEY